MTVNMILGAGFSVNAGLPTVSDISQKFLQNPLEDFTLYFGSGEWKWTEWANEAEMNNGRIQPLGLEIGYLISFFVAKYMETAEDGVLNYEKFYQYVFDLRYNQTELFEEMLGTAQRLFLEKYKFQEVDFDQISDYEIFSCLYHLIEDLLWVRISYDDIEERYREYINFFKSTEELNIFTLNHDILLERIFEHEGLAYRDGFSTDNKVLLGYTKNRLFVFDNTFSGPINLIKLHGSIDTYQYAYTRDANRHKGYDYFKTLDFHDKQMASDVNEDGLVIQNTTPQIIPRFITGENKFEVMRTDTMYVELYKRFENVLPKGEKLIIIGYSYADKHINEVISRSLKENMLVININPSVEFPFRHDKVKNINPLTENLNLY